MRMRGGAEAICASTDERVCKVDGTRRVLSVLNWRMMPGCGAAANKKMNAMRLEEANNSLCRGQLRYSTKKV
jgi:hypothetical protein